MAHLKKNTRGAVPGLAVHFERKTDHHTNKEIDVSKTYLNQELLADGSDMLSRFNARLNDVYCMQRDDVKALATWIVTLPEELAESPYEQQSVFFEATTNFLNERYGQENAVAAVVHYDETTPHLHYAFVPVVFDDKKTRYKVSAKEVLTRHDLQTFHDDLDQHLKKELPFYEQGILNNKTLPFENVAEIKKYNDQFNALKNELADVEENIRAKQAVLKITDQALQKRHREQQQLDYAMRDMLKNDYGVDKIAHTDVEARYVLYKLDHEELTKNKKVAQSWLKTLTTAREDPDTKIAPSRLDWGIEQVKALINRIIELTRDLFKGPSL
ncbi:MobV family relaxase [Leuconostoc lactis]|uniref:MobV family relaxase n=1 Tax=Leuconostoc lactis TaxID=1246 RepID=UPI000A01778B|nr:MobV family relaxase [Leuconostoc lactis]ORI83423.1 mobilization protein [Leuconostoc lactis]ORI85967.1 mobilization protein [Leuconostoc lactis]